MPEDIEALLGTQFVVLKTKFAIDENGFVIADDGMDLGHIKDCLEDGKPIMDLTELFENIDF